MKSLRTPLIKLNSFASLCMCMILVLLSACGTQEQKLIVPQPSIAQDSIIAQDFVNVMVQIDSLSPWSTVLSFGVDNNTEENDQLRHRLELFGRALRTTAANNGYAVKSVESDDALLNIRYSISDTSHEVAPMMYTYDLSVGGVDFRREYMPLENGGIEPHKAMMVRGADVSELVTDDSIFERSRQVVESDLMAQSDPASSGGHDQFGSDQSTFNSPLQVSQQALPVKPSSEQLSETLPTQLAEQLPEQPITVTQTEPLPAIAQPDGPAQPLVPAQQPVELATTPLVAQKPAAVNHTNDSFAGNVSGYQTVRKANIAESGMSNYENLLSGKQDVAAEVLIFGDDSYVLGARNKQLLGDVMTDFNPDTDVVSIVGCSTGVTKIENGNAALAIGRANRVKEALLYSGIPHDKIYDEGCWSPTPNSTPFPNRGVVITVKRSIASG